MSKRGGEYRCIRRVLLDDPEFQALPVNARTLLLYLKINFGPTGMDVWYEAELVIRLAQQSGLGGKAIGRALAQLEEAQWIRRELHLIWVVGQLDDDPHMKPSDEKHRKSIQLHVAGLPNLPLKERFVEAHPKWFADAPSVIGETRRAFEGPSEGLRRVHEDPSEALGTTDEKTEYETKNETKNTTKKRGSTREREQSSPLPAAVLEFCRRFYSNASSDRKRQILSQLRDTLEPAGAAFEGGRLRAPSRMRLSKKCEEVMREGVRIPDRAIVVLFKKLADVTDDSPTERAADALTAAAENEHQDVVRVADEWAGAHPAEYHELELDSLERYPGDDNFRTQLRRGFLLSQILQRAKAESFPGA